MKKNGIFIRIILFPAALEVKEGQTAKLIKDKILDILQMYKLDIRQIYSATSDNGANMIAAIKKLQKLSEFDPEILLNDCDADNDFFLESFNHEFASHLNLVRCAAHTVQLAVSDVMKRNDADVQKITEFVKETRKVKYKLFFEHMQAKTAPLWTPTRWNGKFKMCKSILKQESFYIQLVQQYKELSEYEHFIQQAFQKSSIYKYSIANLYGSHRS